MKLYYTIKNIMFKTKYVINTSKLLNRKEPILTESKEFTKSGERRFLRRRGRC